MLASDDRKDEELRGSGGGGFGGGMVAFPKGIFEVTEKKTRYIPADPNRYLLIGGVAGFLLARLLFRRKNK